MMDEYMMDPSERRKLGQSCKSIPTFSPFTNKKQGMSFNNDPDGDTKPEMPTMSFDVLSTIDMEKNR